MPRKKKNSDMMEYKPTMHFSEKDSPKKDAKLGEKVKFVVEGRIKHISEDMHDGKKHKNQMLEIDKVKKMPAKKKTAKKSVRRKRAKTNDRLGV